MPSNMQDFIGTFINLKQLLNQTQQVAIQADAQKQQVANSAVAGVNTFMELARQTADPTQLTELVNRFSQLGVGTPDQLTGILAHLTPSNEALKASVTKQGIDVAAGGGQDLTPASRSLATDTANANLVGQNAGQRGQSQFLADLFNKMDTHGAFGDALATGLASRTAVGLTPGQQAIDTATTQLPGPEILQAAGVAAGTRMSAGQNAQTQLGYANLREEDRKTTMMGGYQMGQLMIDQQKADLMKEAAKRKGIDPAHVVSLIDAKNSLLKTITESKNANPSAVAITSMIGGLNAINAQMAQLGLPNEGQINYDPNELIKPGAWDKFMSGPQTGKSGMPSLGPTPVNQYPAGAGRK